MLLWGHKYIHVSRRTRERIAKLAPEDVRSVAVIKHAALGDLALTRPLLVEVRRAFPNARITFGAIANYMHGVPEDLVDRVHVAAGQFRPRPSLRERIRSYRELGYHDLLFDVTASSASMWISALNPAQLKIGFRHHPLSDLIYDVTLPRGFMSFEAENFLHPLAILRVRYEWPPDFGYPPHVAASDPPYLVYFPTASTPVKCWEAGNFGELMARLAQALPDHEHRLLYGTAEWEIAAADRALAAAGARANIRAVRDAKGEPFRDLLRGATLMIGNDTGVRNLAIALGTPTLCIFAAGMVDTYRARFPHHDTVHNRGGGQPSVAQVEQAAMRLLEAIRRCPNP